MWAYKKQESILARVLDFLVLKPALKSQVIDSGELTVRRIWAFNRVPGSRKAIDDFIIEQGVFEKDARV